MLEKTVQYKHRLYKEKQDGTPSMNDPASGDIKVSTTMYFSLFIKPDHWNSTIFSRGCTTNRLSVEVLQPLGFCF